MNDAIGNKKKLSFSHPAQICHRRHNNFAVNMELCVQILANARKFSIDKTNDDDYTTSHTHTLRPFIVIIININKLATVGQYMFCIHFHAAMCADEKSIEKQSTQCIVEGGQVNLLLYCSSKHVVNFKVVTRELSLQA